MLACLRPLERCARDDQACIFWCDPISSFPVLAGNRGAAQAVARPDVLLFSLSSSPVRSLPLSLCQSDGGYQFRRLVLIGNGMIGGLASTPACLLCCSTHGGRVHLFTLCFQTDTHSWACLYACVCVCLHCMFVCLSVAVLSCAGACERSAPSCKASNGGCLVKLSCFRTVISRVPPSLLLAPSVRNAKNHRTHTHTHSTLSLSICQVFFSLTPSLSLVV